MRTPFDRRNTLSASPCAFSGHQAKRGRILPLTMDKVEALGQERGNFSVIAHTLPPSASIDGVLGLDFFRGHVLTLDFQNGEIALV